jgi:dihydroorotate dehydrogenase
MAFFELARALLFRLDPETAHRITIALLATTPVMRPPAFDSILRSELAGISFPSPVGLAAGFDKDAQVPAAMLGLGFGFVEVGTVTPLPQGGNPRPRLFRLVEDEGVINRMGFNNGGGDAALKRLETRRNNGVVGVNIGANKDTADRVLDYVNGLAAFAPVADYITVNVSSPNTPGLRGLQEKGALDELLDGVLGLRSAPGYNVPVFLKVAPDLTPTQIDDIASVAIGRGVDALIVSNTTISRPALHSRLGGEAGGLSGAPLKSLAAQRLKDFRSATGGAIPLISAGGIADADEAYARIRNGASLIQLYSALVFHGPGLAKRIADGLATRLRTDGFASLGEAIGVDAA